MCICMCVCLCVCACACLCVCVCLYLYLPISVCVSVCMCLSVYVRLCKTIINGKRGHELKREEKRFIRGIGGIEENRRRIKQNKIKYYLPSLLNKLKKWMLVLTEMIWYNSLLFYFPGLLRLIWQAKFKLMSNTAYI